jgi:8-amino-7-oxononanoate synthase
VTDAVWNRWLDAELDSVRAAGRWRQLRPLDGPGPDFVAPDQQRVISFASNDYLGLASHPNVVAAAGEAGRRWGVGSGSSRLIVGDRPIHHQLEEDLAAWRGAEAALVFATGYQANLAVMTTLGAAGRVVSDERNHASIIDGARLARTEVCVYRHGDVDQASHLVASAAGRALVVSDSVFSMDGDLAPIAELSQMCARQGAILVLDDAHAVFSLPPVDPAAGCLRVGTLSKALGSQGGYVTGPKRWIELFVNRARSFIFTTGLAPTCAAAACAAVGICRSDEGAALIRQLRENVDAVRAGHPSPIVPVILGDERSALAAADRLYGQGLLVPAVRPPTVPAGTSRLRVSLSAAHRPYDVARLNQALGELATPW